MKKRIFVVALITVLIALLTVSTVLASPVPANPEAKKTPQSQGNGNGNGTDKDKGNSTDKANGSAKDKNLKAVNYHGVVMSYSATSLTLLLKDGSTVSFVMNEKSGLKLPTLSKTSTIADLQYNMRVVVHAYLDKTTGVLTVRSINVVPSAALDYNFAGAVTDYQPGVSITITNPDGTTTTYLLDANTQIILEDPTLVLGPDSQVVVILALNSTGETPVATAIVVKAPVIEPTETATGTAEGSLGETPVPTVEPTVEP
jgi:hypothetical protein